MLNRIPRPIEYDAFSVSVNLSAVTFISAEDRAQGFGAAGTNESSQAQNFTVVQVEVYPARITAKPQIFNLDRRWPVRALGCRAARSQRYLQFASHHEVDDLRWVRGCDRQRRDPASVAKNRDGVAELEDLIQVMRHVYDCHSGGAHVADDLEQPSDLSGG